MRIADCLLMGCLALLVNGCSRQVAAPPPASMATALPSAALDPRIVLQFGHAQPVVAVKWLNGSSHLLSLGEDGAIVIWDTATGAIVDQARIPVDGDPSEAKYLRFQDIRADEGSGRLLFFYTINPNADQLCPAAARGAAGQCSYSFDLATRRIAPDGTLPAPAKPVEFGRTDPALNFPTSPDGRLRPLAFEPGTDDVALVISSSGNVDGCDRTEQCNYLISLESLDGSAPPRKLQGHLRSMLYDVGLSDDGRRLVKMEATHAFNGTRVESLNFAEGSTAAPVILDRHYSEVAMLDDDRFAIMSDWDMPGSSPGFGVLESAPVLVVGRDCARAGNCGGLESYQQMVPLDGKGSFLGAGPREEFAVNPSMMTVEEDSAEDAAAKAGISLYVAGDGVNAGGWQLMEQPDWGSQVITALKLSPDRTRLAVATEQRNAGEGSSAETLYRVWLLDIDGKSLVAGPRERVRLAHREGEGGVSTANPITALDFTPDGEKLLFTQGGASVGQSSDLYVVDLDPDGQTRKIPGFSASAIAAGNHHVFGLERQELAAIDSGAIVSRTLNDANVFKAGVIAGSRLFWAANVDGSISFRDSSDGSLQLTLYVFPDSRYFAVAPGGRYDTNLSADTQLVRWLVPDAPWQSLAAQTFMRDYYEPGLYRRLLDCRASDTCATAFKPLPAIASLNRVLPEVRITGVRAGRDAAEAVVAVEVREGVDADAPNGKSRSGLYNPRLFRNGRLVAMKPRQPDAAGSDLAQWRQRNAVQAAGGVHQLEFTVPVPTQVGEELQEFSAYAFNEDRIKGETDTLQWTRDPIAPRPRRAYVLAIGIDDYDTPRFRLNYAVADARLMASRLSDIPGYETHSLVLAAERGADGRRTRVDRATLARVLSLLAGDADREATLAALRADGIDASMLQPATPDDAVIVSFSGHGWANPSGDFYLIPGDGRWPEGSEAPDLSTVFATADLVAPFQLMHANEITLVIDACHSAASVADGRFKPGPMGDSGLGQLAYDKGIRILAATQADDVALEDARLGQGLLTYALAVDGLGGGQADLDADGSIRTDEWLAYAVQRLPGLANDARVGRIGAAGERSRAITFSDLPAEAPARRVQQPALFDFNPQPSSLVLRKGRP
jgi:WD40 repeat protein